MYTGERQREQTNREMVVVKRTIMDESVRRSV